jgi:DNA repair protein RecO (recombination protein O)
MPLLRTLALTLRRRRTREADALLTLFTREGGKAVVSTKSVRKSSSRLAGVTQPFNLLDVILYAKSHDQEIWSLTQASLIRTFTLLQTDLEKMTFAACLGEWVDALSGEFEANEPAWALILEAFERFEGSPVRAEDLLYYQLRLLRISGLQPTIGRCLRCGASNAPRWGFQVSEGGLLCNACSSPGSSLSHAIQGGTLQALRGFASASSPPAIRLSDEQFQEAEALLRLHLEFHAGVQPRSSLFLTKMRRLRQC